MKNIDFNQLYKINKLGNFANTDIENEYISFSFAGIKDIFYKLIKFAILISTFLFVRNIATQFTSLSTAGTVIILRLIFFILSVTSYFYIEKSKSVLNSLIVIATYFIYLYLMVQASIYINHNRNSLLSLTWLILMINVFHLFSFRQKIINISISFMVVLFYFTTDFSVYYYPPKLVVTMLVYVIVLITVILYVSIRNKTIFRNTYKDRKHLEYLASIDGLTGILNRQSGIDKINMLLNNKESFGLVLFDIDNFKKINDVYGHNFGDYVLKELIEITSQAIRNDDLLMRWGGEEFVIVSKNLNKEKTYELSERIRTTVNNFNFKEIGNVTISLGIYVYNSDDEKLEKIIEKADAAMYSAKKKRKK